MAVIKQTNSASIARASGGGVFDLGDLRQDAQRTLDAARAEAARLLDAARRESSALRTEAEKRGFAEGHAKGHEAGLAEGRAQGLAQGRAEAQAAHHEMLSALEKAFTEELVRWTQVRDARLREAERELAGIAVAIAEGIVRTHVKHDQASVAREVEAAVSLFARATRVVVEISPEDEPIVAESLPALRGLLAQGAELSLVARAGIERGGCIVRSGDGLVDARLETQFRRMHACLVGEGTMSDADAGAAPAASEDQGAEEDAQP